ncbi:MAG: CxxC-x17-CxxC domain-containing protein [Patescibacteria group bacterium]
MGFNKFDKHSGGKSFGGDRIGGGGRKFGGKSDVPRQLFKAVCAKCNQSCEVPFRPIGGRPVFCSNCFKTHDEQKPSFQKSFGGGSSNTSFVPSVNVSVSNAATKAQVDALNAKLDRILDILTNAMKEEVQEVKAEEKNDKKKKIAKIKSPVKKAKAKKK